MQFTEQLPWVDWLGLSYHLGVDGISLPLIILNQLLTLIAILSSPDKLERPRLYYSLMLVLNLSVTGAFLSQDLLLFFIFYELELIPLYLLIAIWGGARRNYAATKFLLYTATSGIFILAAFLGLVWLTGASSFDYRVLAPGTLPLASQLILLTGLFIGFAIKIPIFSLPYLAPRCPRGSFNLSLGSLSWGLIEIRNLWPVAFLRGNVARSLVCGGSSPRHFCGD